MTLRHACILTVATLCLTACVRQERIAGNIFSEASVEQIKSGETTKADVERLLGSPSSRSDFGTETWLYVNSIMENHAFLEPRVQKRTIVAVGFDDSGTVNEVQRFTEQDGRVINVATQKTPTEGRSLNAIQQLLGNVGKFNQKAADGGD
jgi:outer membrane protein assembly factor BamE (lipoprotein component of BamABCDE complex)